MPYNAAFKSNINLVLLLYIAPVAYLLGVSNIRSDSDNATDVNAIIHIFYTSFTYGYLATFLLEALLATALRIAVFSIWEPAALFELTPRIPLPVLPWVLRGEGYRPKRITLFVADLAVSCVAAPIVEELVKLKVVQWYGRLPRNYYYYAASTSSSSSVTTATAAAATAAGAATGEVTDINTHITTMLACSLGLKLADSDQRGSSAPDYARLSAGRSCAATWFLNKNRNLKHCKIKRLEQNPPITANRAATTGI